MLSLSLGLASPESQASGVTWEVQSRWESKYVSEGRDNLGEGGIFSTEAAAVFRSMRAGIWYGYGDRASYDELQLSLEYAGNVRGASARAGYARLQFPRDGTSDNELSAGIACPLMAPLSLGLDAVYSTGADGSFVSISLELDLRDLLDGKLELHPYLLEGLDFGYRSERHDGVNNLEAGAAFSVPISDRFAVVGCVCRSFAQEDVTREDGEDQTWAGIGVAGNF